MLSSVHGVPFAVVWLAWLAYWFVAALNVKRTERRERFAPLILNRAPLVIGALLLAFERQPLHWLSSRFLPLSQAFYWIGLFMLVAGLAFAVWARRYLGRNWSGIVTVKQDHELIRSGPYALVRHPIYTGLLFAILGTAVAIGEWRGLIAFVLITAGFVIKLRTEEKFMSETFGTQYAHYRAEVPALIPFLV
ncbi:MAG TPA: isoprenylcysteine carboxylmethyltransferase family protein [Xanthobacteraceae bacterium]